jgi:hypothetical protein
MDFFSRGYTALRGERGQPQSADETIEKLADCLETATLLEDRRAGVLSLKGLVRDWPEVKTKILCINMVYVTKSRN